MIALYSSIHINTRWWEVASFATHMICNNVQTRAQMTCSVWIRSLNLWPSYVTKTDLTLFCYKKRLSCQVRVKKQTSLWTARWGNVLLHDWFHFVAIWHSTTGLSLYIDGCIVQHKITPATTQFTNDTNIKHLVLGRASNVNNYYGAVILDEFYIYEYAQPESFVSETYWYYF